MRITRHAARAGARPLGPRVGGAARRWRSGRPSAPANTVVQRWQTSQAGDLLARKADLTFTADAGTSLPTIEIDPDRYEQAIDGFGATFNEAGWFLLSKLSASERANVMRRVFNAATGAPGRTSPQALRGGPQGSRSSAASKAARSSGRLGTTLPP